MAKEKKKTGTNGISEYLGREKLSPVKYWLSTGCTLLDIAIADRFPGGVPGGRVIHIVGGESSAKTLLAQSILGSVQRSYAEGEGIGGGQAYYDDSEMSLDFTRCALFGLNTEANFTYFQSEHIEQFFDETVVSMLNRKHSEIPAAGVCDSLSALPSVKELDEELTKDGYKMARPKIISEAFRKYVHQISEKNLTLVFVDQTRTNVGVLFGDKETWSGGKALGFYATVRIRLRVKGKIKNKREMVSGVKIHFRVDKNKVAPPFREGDFELSFDYGIEDVKSNLNFLHENIDLVDGIEVKQGVGWVYEGKRIGDIDKMVEFVERENLEDEVKKKVWSTWRILQETPERKAREWK